MLFRIVYKSGQIFLPFCHNSRVWRTDRQTDRRTDRRTEFSSLDRVCITCSAVKMAAVESQDSGTMMALCANYISMGYLDPRLAVYIIYLPVLLRYNRIPFPA